MLTTNNNLYSSDVLAEAFAQTIETMAFMMALPVEDILESPCEAVMVSMDFKGPISGHIELAAGIDVVICAAANIMGLEQDDPLAREKGVDAFKEILNTTCGILLPRLASSPDDIFDVTIPQSEIIENKNNWQNYVDQPDVIMMDIDFKPVAARMVISR
ncbi:MAG: chemotaxis protein CheX [Sedimentisphaerales bacterium]|nr:chemotaxis protein CheX [Sedimentisphaerales bacterium]MBN2841827.1 chemotaxis protein CheX [Sedimentisphaerales bacterium]